MTEIVLLSRIRTPCLPIRCSYTSTLVTHFHHMTATSHNNILLNKHPMRVHGCMGGRFDEPLTPVSSGYKPPLKTFAEILAYTLSLSRRILGYRQTFCETGFSTRSFQAVIRFRLWFCEVASYNHASGG